MYWGCPSFPCCPCYGWGNNGGANNNSGSEWIWAIIIVVVIIFLIGGWGNSCGRGRN